MNPEVKSAGLTLTGAGSYNSTANEFILNSEGGSSARCCTSKMFDLSKYKYVLVEYQFGPSGNNGYNANIQFGENASTGWRIDSILFNICSYYPSYDEGAPYNVPYKVSGGKYARDIRDINEMALIYFRGWFGKLTVTNLILSNTKHGYELA